MNHDPTISSAESQSRDLVWRSSWQSYAIFGLKKSALWRDCFGVPIKVFSTYTPKNWHGVRKWWFPKRTILISRGRFSGFMLNFRVVNSLLQDLWSKHFPKFLHDFSNSCRKRSNFSRVVPPPLRNLLIFTCFFGVMKSRVELLLQLLRRLAPRLSVPQARRLQQTRQPGNWRGQSPGAPNSREFTKTSLSFRCKMAPERKGSDDFSHLIHHLPSAMVKSPSLRGIVVSYLSYQLMAHDGPLIGPSLQIHSRSLLVR